MPFFTQWLKRSLITVSGLDAESFLQGLLTVDVSKLQVHEARYALLLTPQGKCLYDFFIYRTHDHYVLDVEEERAESLLSRLTMYRLRARVVLSQLPDSEGVLVLWSEINLPSIPGALCVSDPRYKELGMRIIGDKSLIPDYLSASEAGDYLAHRIALGVPEGSVDLVPEKALPLEYGLDRLHAVDFDKGCYVGQEVTARTKYRAHLRKQVYIVRSEQPLPGPGCQLHSGDKPVGELHSTSGKMGLALINNELLEGATQVSAQGVAAQLLTPAWRQ